MRVACISDTHMRHDRVAVPPCDLLLHAGDVTRRGTMLELQAFLDWFGAQPIEHRVFVAGNHDLCCEREEGRTRTLAEEAGVVYLQDETVELGGLRLHGSPITPTFRNMAFNRDPGPAIQRHWDAIEAELDVLVTHGPPRGVLDRTFFGAHVGCEDLWTRVEAVAPRVHVFGHIHEAHGQDTRPGLATRFVNAASVPLLRRSPRPPLVLDL